MKRTYVLENYCSETGMGFSNFWRVIVFNFRSAAREYVRKSKNQICRIAMVCEIRDHKEAGIYTWDGHGMDWPNLHPVFVENNSGCIGDARMAYGRDAGRLGRPSISWSSR